MSAGQIARVELAGGTPPTTSNGQISRVEVAGGTPPTTSNGQISRIEVLVGVVQQFGQIARVEAVVASTLIASAGGDIAGIEPYHTVTLVGSETGSPASVSKKWRQISGPAVTLTGATTATATYEAPGTLTGTALVFGYAVTGSGFTSPEDSTTHTVLPVTERAVIGGVEVPMKLEQVAL